MRTSKDVLQANKERVQDLLRSGDLSVVCEERGFSIRSGGETIASCNTARVGYTIEHVVNTAIDMIADLEEAETSHLAYEMLSKEFEKTKAELEGRITKLEAANRAISAKAEFFQNNAINLAQEARESADTANAHRPIVMMAIAAVKCPSEASFEALRKVVDDREKEY